MGDNGLTARLRLHDRAVALGCAVQVSEIPTRALEGLGPIDLVVDDGPPRYVGNMLRYASLPVLSKLLAPRGTFVLDAVGDEERIVLERWRREFPVFAQEHLTTRKGNVILRRSVR